MHEVVDLGAAGFLLVIGGWQVAQVGLHVSPGRIAFDSAYGWAAFALVCLAGVLARQARRVTRPTAKQRLELARAHPAPAVADR